MSDLTVMSARRDLLPVIVERENATLPEGFTTWGIKSVRADLKAFGGYQWPLPGNVAVATDVDEGNTSACPNHPGDGLCVATDWAAMASGGIPARTLLLVATRGEPLGSGPESKTRHREVAVVALVDGERLLRESGAGVDLRGADLRGADLAHVYLRGADLRGANLVGAYLAHADLAHARFADAYLTDAILRGADLRGADLRGADLAHVYLRGADLRGANLVGAYGRTDWDALVERGAIR